MRVIYRDDDDIHRTKKRLQKRKGMHGVCVMCTVSECKRQKDKNGIGAESLMRKKKREEGDQESSSMRAWMMQRSSEEDQTNMKKETARLGERQVEYGLVRNRVGKNSQAQIGTKRAKARAKGNADRTISDVWRGNCNKGQECADHDAMSRLREP